MNWAQVQTLVDVVYPPRCLGCGVMVEGDGGLCPSCWAETPFVTGVSCDQCGVPLIGGTPGEIAQCDDCISHVRPWDRGRAALVYHDRTRQLVMRLKHGDRTDMVPVFAAWMDRAGRDLRSDDTVLVPVPLARGRYFRRRFNQSVLLARALAKRWQVDHVPDALMRVRATESLQGHREDRVQEVDGAFAMNARRGGLLAGRSVMLVDDVMTTGATFEACARVLAEAAPRKIDVISLARVAKDF